MKKEVLVMSSGDSGKNIKPCQRSESINKA